MDRKEIDGITEDLFEIMPVFHKKLLSVMEDGSDSQMTHYHIIILNLISRHGAMSVSEIGKKIAVSRPQMTAMIDKLVAMELVTRRPDFRDRRIIHISITQTGKTALSKARSRIRMRLSKKLSGMDKEDFEMFLTAIRNIKAVSLKLE